MTIIYRHKDEEIWRVEAEEFDRESVEATVKFLSVTLGRPLEEIVYEVVA